MAQTFHDNASSDAPLQAVTILQSPRVRARTFLLGLPLVVALCCLSVYADMASKVVQFGVLQIAPPAVVALVAFALFNRALVKWAKIKLLNPAELIVIYAMCLVGVMVSTRGIIEKLVPPLAYLPYFSTNENRLAESIGQYMPAWAMPFSPSAAVGNADPAISGFWEGNGGAVPWATWLGPLVAWGALWACVVWCFLCLATLLRKQWVDNEQLKFPLTALPLALARDEFEGQPFFSNPMMWAGALFAFCVFGINGLAANFPDVPKIVTDLALTPYLSERPWNAVDYTQLFFSLAAVGFAYFLPTDLLFSLWFFFVLTRLQDAASVQMGGLPTSIGTHNARIWTGFQAAGAYLVLVGTWARIGWPSFKVILQSAWLGRRNRAYLGEAGDDSGELFSYRAAVIGLILSFGGIVLWLSLAGLNPWLALAQMGIYIFFIAIVMSRAVSEAGLLMTETSFLPSHLIALITPLSGVGPHNAAMLGLSNATLTRELRGVLLSPFMDAQKMAAEVGLKPRALRWPLLGSIALSFGVSAALFLFLNYQQGGLALYPYPTRSAANMFNHAAAIGSGSGFVADSTAYGGFAVGIVVTLLLVWSRAQFAWFPLHPLGYALAPTWPMVCFWFPFMVAWVLKSGVLKFGGIETYRRLAPFMLGLIVGEFSAAVFWSLGNILRGWNAPSFPWP